ncbi:hypothetical protein AAG570_005826 [Ranatra chinensis]|uniref:DUF4795 domain-containing protein n=1 Tax=Ranatra chinensis TaxID=642074 RepID=A0ABD0XYL9_9HEMI
MASKRRNMFHKNKTQETTENAKLRGETGSQVTLTEEELEEKRRCLTLEQRMEDVETGLAKHWAMLRRQDATICDRTGLLATRIGSIEMDVQIINKKLHIGMDDEDQVANEELANNPVIRGIAAAGEELASNIKDMTEAIAEMFADKEASDRIVNALAEQVELMNTSKANRFEMDDILAEKADCNQLSDKVALRQFDNLCNFFRESLTEVAQKMEAYERMVQGSMLDLQHGLDTKFDKEEAATLRQSVELNLNVVKQRLDKIDTVKHGNVAAVAKKELMT